MVISILCFRSRLIIDSQTSFLFAHVSSGRGQIRAIFGSDGSPTGARPVGWDVPG